MCCANYFGVSCRRQHSQARPTKGVRGNHSVAGATNRPSIRISESAIICYRCANTYRLVEGDTSDGRCNIRSDSDHFRYLWQRSYSVEAPDLRGLYEKAKRDQWNASRDIAWETPLDLDKGIFADELIDGYGTDALAHLDAKTLARLNVEFSCWRISQLLHGEEGAMLACSQLVDMVPGNDAKFFQSTQVVDEARHTEVLSRYLLDKCDGNIYPVSPNLKTLFDFILGQGKWFIKTVGLQLIAETFAVALFRLLGETAQGSDL